MALNIIPGSVRTAEAEFAPHFVKALFDEDFRVRHAGSQALLELGPARKLRLKGAAVRELVGPFDVNW